MMKLQRLKPRFFKCQVCDTTIKLLEDGYPIYRFGDTLKKDGSPNYPKGHSILNKPGKASVYFCSPQCASLFSKEIKEHFPHVSRETIEAHNQRKGT